jgi:hypothetical protein
MLKILLLGVVSFLFSAQNRQDWVCFVNSVKKDDCGVYGYSKSKKIAIKEGFLLCESHCKTECKLEYCEKL